MKDRGDVDIILARTQHRNYCEELHGMDYSIIVMPPEPCYPDSVFVEDPNIIVRDALIIARLRREERRGEEERLAKWLHPYFSKIGRIEPPGFVEGGDVLITHDSLYIGISERTNWEGAEQLSRLARDLAGYAATAFEIPKSYLHLKGEATFHRNAMTSAGKHILTTSEEIAHHFRNSGCEIVETPAEERFGANCISDNRRILVHAGRSKTRRRLENHGFAVQEINISEFEKIDGAMTCLSKLWT